MALTYPGRFRSVCAFAPICNLPQSDWGRKQFSADLGADKSVRMAHDSVEFLKKQGLELPLLIDQGSVDKFLDLLKIDTLQGAIAGKESTGNGATADGL